MAHVVIEHSEDLAGKANELSQRIASSERCRISLHSTTARDTLIVAVNGRVIYSSKRNPGEPDIHAISSAISHANRPPVRRFG